VSDDDNATTVRTVRSPFGIEVDRRESHLSSLPGKRYQDWFRSLDRAAQVFSGNSSDLEAHFKTFVGTPTFATELSDDFGDTAARLLHNYLAALGTLRDAQRAVHHRIWPARYSPDDPRDDPKDKRTIWETEIWAPKVAELFGDGPAKFLIGLRNYSLHYAIPVTDPSTSFASIQGSGGPMAMTNSVLLQCDELLKWDGWSRVARDYIEAQDGGVDVLHPIALYSTRVREFIMWFFGHVEESGRVAIDEYHAKHNEYVHWRNVEGTWGHFGMDGRIIQFRKVAEARLERAKYGTRGWREITRDEDGEWVVGERDAEWPPLPKGPR